jgi:prophage tail gpP-like protein
MSDFQIRVEGQRYDLWQSARVFRSIDKTSGVFSFTSTSTSPIKAGSRCQILLNDVAILTGFIDSFKAQGSMVSGQNISVEGRDNTADLIDSSMKDDVKMLEGPLSLKALCERVISSLGASIPVTSNIDISDFGEQTNFTADSGRGCMEFLVDFARKKQVYLIADGEGRLELFRPGANRSNTALLNEKNGVMNNVISWSVAYKHQDRFNTYVVRSQDNFGFDDDADYADQGVSRTGDAIDSEIRSSRYFERQTPETSDGLEVVQSAIELANLRKAKASEYNCVVAGATQPNGDVWAFGQLVSVSDDFAGLKGMFLIKAVDFNIDVKRGSTTTLTLVPPEAYQVRLTTPGDERLASRSPDLQTSSPSNTKVFIR